MARENRLWGAERNRGELLKLGVTVAKHTLQKYIARVRPTKPASQTWACNFLPVIDLWFRPLYLFFVVELASRWIVHFRVTRSPTDGWVARQLRATTPFDLAPRFLIWDRDSKYGQAFTRVAVGTSIAVLKTPFHLSKTDT
ncbi:MAG: hypothetical protein HZB51_10680 [Chloroflexi bacterium]|nr:hypothetical protein [Chloroflexota bacterium]